VPWDSTGRVLATIAETGFNAEEIAPAAEFGFPVRARREQAVSANRNRFGRMKRAHTPATRRSETPRLGERWRDRFRISSWCLRSTDSATTERAPPGPASRATVARRCRTRTARSRTAATATAPL
jgi:hypothetical protein